MTTAREQAQEKCRRLRDEIPDEPPTHDEYAAAASDIWEPLVKEALDHIQRQFCETSTEELDRIEMIKKLTEALGDEITAVQARHPSAGNVQPLDVEVPWAVVEALSEAQAADEARSGVHDVQRGFVTKSGKILTDADIQALADEAERGYDVEHLKGKPNRRG